MIHARFGLDSLTHSPVRFSIMGYLRNVDGCEFTILRDAVELSDSSLSQNLTRLAEAGFLTIEKRQSGRRVKTWIASTEDGDQALERNLAVLRDIAGEAQKSTRPHRFYATTNPLSTSTSVERRPNGGRSGLCSSCRGDWELRWSFHGPM